MKRKKWAVFAFWVRQGVTECCVVHSGTVNPAAVEIRWRARHENQIVNLRAMRHVVCWRAADISAFDELNARYEELRKELKR
jgi:hypothetical protein